MSSKICFISPYSKLTALLASHFGDESNPPLILEDRVMDGESATLDDAENLGSEVIVTTAFHARTLRSNTSLPVIAIPLSTFDIAMAVNEAQRKYGEPVAMFEPHESSPHLEQIGAMLNCTVTSYVFIGPNDAQEKIVQARGEGCLCGIGGGINEKIAKDQGFHFVTLFPGPEAISLAYQQAQQIADVQRKERYEANKFKYTVEFASSGIVVVDQQGILSVFNPAAENLLQVSAKEILNKRITEIFPSELFNFIGPRKKPQLAEIKQYGKRRLMVNTIPITDRGRYEGTIFTFQELSHIQSLEEKIRRASHKRSLTARLTFKDIVAKSPAISKIASRARHFAASDETILITGETGTGKEIFAQSLHNASQRRDRPFVAVSCATIPASLLESELFGYVEGAFTGALRGGKQGFFELAHGGTIFLDEIGEIPTETQVLLLRVLQEREIMRIGDAKIIPVNVRIIAATNRCLHEAVAQGDFRLDLYHRLNILRIEIPPLRQRKEDILPLSQVILNRICSTPRFANKIYKFLQGREQALAECTWPGNVRELENLLRRMVASLEVLRPADFTSEAGLLLEEFLQTPLAHEDGPAPALPRDLKEVMAVFEQTLLAQKLDSFSGNKEQLARELGIGRTTLWRKLKKL